MINKHVLILFLCVIIMPEVTITKACSVTKVQCPIIIDDTDPSH